MFHNIGLDIVKELLKQTTVTMASASTSYVLFLFIFMMDRLIAMPAAKLFFVMGYLIFMIIFYTIGVIVFPSERKGDDVELTKVTSAKDGDGDGDGGGGDGDGDGSDGSDGGAPSDKEAGGDDPDGGGDDAADGGGETENNEMKKHMSFFKMLIKSKQLMRNMFPFANNTQASFYNFSIGYLAGYWSNLNLQKKSDNAQWLMCYYLVIVFVYYTFSVFVVESCSWKAGLISSALGILVGMLWSQLVYESIQEYEPDMREGRVLKSQSGGNNVHRCNNDANDDMVCKAFRL